MEKKGTGGLKVGDIGRVSIKDEGRRGGLRVSTIACEWFDILI